MDLVNNGNISIASLLLTLNTRINELEKEKQYIETELQTYKTKYTELNIVAIGYIDTIRELREEKQRLEKEIADLRASHTELIASNTVLLASNTELIASNSELIARVKVLEDNEAKNILLLKIGQCVYDYKCKLKMRIDGTKLKSKWELFDIINGMYDKFLSPTAKANRDTLINEIETKYGSVRELQTMLSDTTADRVKNAHPVISDEYLALKPQFLAYCNDKWSDDVDANIIFADDVFSVLTE